MLSSVRGLLRILLEVCNLCFNITKYSSNVLVKNMFFYFELWLMFLSLLLKELFIILIKRNAS